MKYIAIEDKVYSLSNKQYRELQQMIDSLKPEGPFGAREGFYKILEYIEEIGKIVLSLAQSYRY